MSINKKHLLWERAHKLVIRIYKYSNEFPESENLNLNLIRLLRSCGIHMCIKIVKLPQTNSLALVEICNSALNSIAKIRYYLFLSNDLGYGNPNENQKKFIQQISPYSSLFPLIRTENLIIPLTYNPLKK